MTISGPNSQKSTRFQWSLTRGCHMSYTLKSVIPHATGLRLPTHLAVTDDGQVLVSEFAGHAVRDVTEPGDYADQSRGRFLDDVANPGGLLAVGDSTVLVADSGDQSIRSVTRGQDASQLARNIPNVYSVVAFRGKILASFFSDDAVGIIELSDEINSEIPGRQIVTGFPCVTVAEPFPKLEAYGGAWAATAFNDRLLLCHAGLGTIFDVSDGGTFEELRSRRFAWGLRQPAGMIADPLDNELYVCEKGTGSVRHLRESGYARFAPVLVTGFDEPVCVRFDRAGQTVFITDRAVGAVYQGSLEHRED
jgi:hypothetical protein